jgi:hypothetical protein
MLKRALLLPLFLFACDATEAPRPEGDLTARCGFVGEVGLVGLDSVDISGNPAIFGAYGSVFSNEKVSLSGSFDVEGWAVSGGTVSMNGSGSVGGVIEHAGRISVYDPSADVTAAATKNDNAKIPCVKKGNKCTSPLSGTSLSLAAQSSIVLPAGKYYLTSLSVSGQAKIDVTGDVVVYLAGPATLNGGSATNPSTDSLSLVSSSTAEIKLNGSSTARTSIHAPFATVRFAGTNGFRGSAVARDLRISGTADLEPVGNLTTVYGAACGDAGGADAGGDADGGGGADSGSNADGGGDAGETDGANGSGNGNGNGNGSGNGGGTGDGDPMNRDEPPDMSETGNPG